MLKTFSSLSARALVAAIIAAMVVSAPLPIPNDVAKATAAPAFDATGIGTSANGLSILNMINSAGNPAGGALGGTKPDVTSFLKSQLLQCNTDQHVKQRVTSWISLCLLGFTADLSSQ